MGPDEIAHAQRVLIVAAHPDDEVIGAGAQFRSLAEKLTVVHVTDGSPRNLTDAHAAGFATRQEYATARRNESLAAGALAGMSPQQFECLGIVDQEASFNLVSLANRIAAIFESLRPDVVITHPYEGGHPDHDATAFAVQAALLNLPRPRVWEFTSYHAGPEGIETGCFLAHANAGESVAWEFSRKEQALKARMLACFVTQREMLKLFGLRNELFRLAPRYDFAAPPHAGLLYYEGFNWGMNGAGFLELARSAIAVLGTPLNNAAHSS